MISEELKQEIKKEVAIAVHEIEITDIKVEKLRNEIANVKSELKNEITGVESRLRVELKAVENRLDNKISDVKITFENRISKLEGMMKVIITITSATAIGIVMLMLKDIFK